jgi:hypothetical protein
MYSQFNLQQFYALPAQCIYVFCMDFYIRCVGKTDCDTSQCLAIAKFRERLSISQQVGAQLFD